MSHTRRVSFSIATTAESACTLPNFESASEVWRDNAGVICARGILSGAYAWLEFPGTAVFHFDRARRAVIAMPEPSVEDGLLYDNYYRAALPLALQYFGVEVLHASAVLTRLGVVAFCAVSETGKSTTVAVLSRRGYPLWADDAVPIEIDEGARGARALAVPFRLRLDAALSPAFRDLDRSFRWPEPERLDLASAPLAALCVMQRVDSSQTAEICRLSAIDAVTALLPHSYCFSLMEADRKRLMMRCYIELAARVPTFAVSIATGLERLPAALDQIERTIPGFT
ncbi:MAG: hypothetical protein QOK03_1986 [Candidatus Binataceae bacterium]|nr:hypothetical protein [Candidatus Binataceae bacterium]